MPQLTNLNTFPYFDDFDRSKGFHKVLFKPGQPVQARELTTLQSILQNQIEEFGNHVFKKEGSVVIPGTLDIRNTVYNIKIEETFNGIDVSQYVESLIGKNITGQTSGVKAQVTNVQGYNLFLRILSSGSNNKPSSLQVGENIIIEERINLTESGITSFNAGDTVGVVQSNNTGCVAVLTDGVFYLRGYFVSVDSQTVIISTDNPIPSCTIGFNIIESLVDVYDDESLYDNSQGFVNYAAPGADRFKIEAVLVAVIDDEEDVEVPQNFVELMKVENGIKVSSKIDNPQYNILGDEMARRTYEESGHYYVKPFKLDVKNSLNDFKGNEGIYTEDELTSSGKVPSDDIGIFKVSPGKAYVKGYEVNIPSNVFLDFNKPRTTKSFTNQSVAYLTGSTFSLNRVYGSSKIGFSTSYILSLRDERVGSSSTIAAGKEIGLARVYDFALESGSYDTLNPDSNVWDLSLFDVVPFTDIIVNESISSVQTPTFIEGKSSGAVGFLRYDVSNSGILTAYNVRGNFIKGEELVFDGVDSDRIAIAVTSHNISNVKSVHGEIGITTFSGDVKQSVSLELGQCTIDSFGFVTQVGRDFTKNFAVGDLVTYNQASQSLPNISRVVSVATSSIGLEAVQSVSGVCIGSLPASQIDFINVNKVETSLQASEDNTLYTPLPKINVSDVDLSNSNIIIRKSFNTTIVSDPTGGKINILPQDIGDNETFLPFDEERYIVINKDGQTEVLTSDKFTITSGGKELIIRGLTTLGAATLVATLKKTKVKSITKIKNRVKTLLVDKSNLEGSGIGATTLNDGLTYGNYPYGTRIQDKEICLLDPDVTKLYGVYESSTISNPALPRMVFSNISSFNSSVNDSLIGEEIFGETSNAIGIVVSKLSSSTIEFVSINGKEFSPGETVTFKESSISATLDSISTGDNNIVSKYNLVKSIKNTFYDYSKIVRKDNVKPIKKILIVYEQAAIDPTDTGNLISVESYQNFNYCDIPFSNSYRNSDIIDIRPRVKSYTVSENSRSPFEFLGRDFNTPQNENIDILSPDEDIILDYSIYLPRIDRVYLTKEKNFQLVYGTPSENPAPPNKIEDALEVAIVSLPAYLCDLKDAKINLLSHKRYQMRDIAKLEDRISSLEYYTTLSLLETNTSNLEIRDSEGNNRFKSGFYVDNFTSTTNQIKYGPKNSIDPSNNELRPSSYTTELDLLLGSRSLTGIGAEKDLRQDPRFVEDLIGVGVRRSTINRLNDSETGPGMGVLSLEYTTVPFVSHDNATRVINAAPYFVNFYKGSITLSPSSDIWIDQARVETQTIEGLLGGYNVTNIEATPQDLDPQAGWSPILWGGWNEEWTGRTVRDRTISSTDSSTLTQTGATDGNISVTNSVTVRETTRTGTATQAGLSTRVRTVPGNNINLGDKIISTNVSSFMRSRNIEIVAKALKPQTQVYVYFDSENVTKYCVPKFIEIEMISGTFRANELVIGGKRRPGITEDLPFIRFRVADLAHRNGEFNNPREFYTTNPYTQDPISNNYSTSSTILNVDLSSLSLQAQGDYYGYIETGMILRGRSSGARARVRSVRLITDPSGCLQASFYIPNSRSASAPKFRSGESTLKITDTETLNLPEGVQSTGAEKSFFSSGQINQVQGTIISTRNVEVTNAYTTQNRSISETTETIVDVNTELDVSLPQPIPVPPPPPPAPVIVQVPVPVPDPVTPAPVPRDPEVIARNECRLEFVQDMGFFVGPDGDPARVVIGLAAVNRMRECGIDDCEIIRRGALQNKRFATRATESLRCSNEVRVLPDGVPFLQQRPDPLAQSFFVGSPEDTTGVFVTSVDLYFRTKSDSETCFVELRPMVNGLPSSTETYPFSHIILEGHQIGVSEDASIPTRVTFKAPVYLEGNKEHCIIIGSNSTAFTLWISRLGEVDIRDQNLPESEQIPIQQQTELGSLFKSQNTYTWTPSQYEDLKFSLNRAQFTTEGTVSFYNPDLSLGNSQVATLQKDSLETTSRRIIVGLGTTAVGWGTEILPGNSVIQDDSNASGNYVIGLGIATGTMSIVNPGLGLTPASGSGFYGFTDIPLTSLTGNGENATADIHVEDGVAIAATISSGGNGFKVGDIVTGTIGQIGRNLQLSISEVYGISEIVLDQVQGDFIVGSGKTIRYINSSGLTTEFSNNASVTLDSSPRIINDGLHIKVNHLNHGMHSPTNTVSISEVLSDISPVTLTSDYSETSTENIAITNASEFETFEGVGVGTTNPGYIQIGSEIISYEGVSGNTLTDITRGIDSTVIDSYDTTDLVYKYENSGISLRRINKDHQLQDATIDEAINLDYYTIRIDNSSNGIDRSTSSSFPTLYLNQSKSTGGSSVSATQNIQYEIMKPVIQSMVLQKTGLSARARTVTATSISGDEISFNDAGYESISLDSDNYFETPRLIASNINSSTLLSDLPGNKSLEIELTLKSYDARLSPIIDLDRVGAIFVSNRVNSIISDYSDDPRVASLKDDPSAFTYAVKPIELEIPANNLRVILAAYINNFSDIRALYAVTNDPSEDLIYYPFPGYDNLLESGQVIDSNDNNGRSDSFVPPTDNKGFESTSLTFKDYEFTIENLPSFKYYSIKLIATSTNQCYPPRIRDFRTIAFA